MKKSLTLACALAGLLWAGTAAARPPGQSGDLAISAERLFGFYMGEQERDREGPAPAIETDISNFALLWNFNTSFLNQPRLSLDYFVTNGLSLGGAFGVFVAKAEDSDATGILFEGRVGYHLSLGRVAGFWPRGGLVYYTINADDFVIGDLHQLALSLQAMFTLSPRDGWAFLLGPTIDFGITGESGNDVDFQEYTIGIMIGILGWVPL